MKAADILKNKKAWTAIIILIALSPIFGVILSDLVGYHEPLDIASEAIGLSERDISEQINWTPLFDYSVPGLPAELGYAVAGAIGVLTILGVGYAMLKIVERGKKV
ncbi:MAG: PDGLE domain-containing protein [Candidatus Nezhaarchaeota archaeon]|nr:PDGLE domain-containing protein [Candidatus Nezhaarchaeota archaeon]MCX8141208.1 PDGLE domain-containing protein [Candidatus Nezhaarchaeota archaeon]MDW8049474.1 PDGLE domain-containing protein [Nitrososphaerota archaeon]